MNSHRLVVLNIGDKQIILRCGNLSTLTDNKIAMIKVLTVQSKLMEEFAGQPVTLQLVFKAISSLNERFTQACVAHGSVLDLVSYDTETAPGCLASGEYASHNLIRQHTCLSLTQSRSPLKCFVVNQKEVLNLGDADMNEVLVGIATLYDINYNQQMMLTKDQLKAQYNGLTKELEFGKQTSKTWYNLMQQIELTRHKLMGSPTWIHQDVGLQDRESALLAIPRPILDAEPQRVTVPMGETTGAAWRTVGCGWS